MLDKEPEIIAGCVCVVMCLVLAFLLRACQSFFQ